jgi:hypothetical protein
MALSAPSESVRMMAQDRMGDFMAAIMPMTPLEKKADSSQLWHHGECEIFPVGAFVAGLQLVAAYPYDPNVLPPRYVPRKIRMAGGSRNALAASSQVAKRARKRTRRRPCRSVVASPARFDTEVVPVDNSASRRCEMQCAISLERVTRNRLVPVYP